ncbi:MAG: winged helix-turn-helix transcriptional regulator [Ruminococcaceae bacterium]|nr:winged helix-turn-helix transcriptional regulator [Oscillospiraceae bacterium]
MYSDAKAVSDIFKAFCDENRIRILHILMDGEKCACRLLEGMNITQPTLSHHMKILCDSGIVSGRKEGKWMYYSISDEGLKKAQAYLDYLKTKGAGE